MKAFLLLFILSSGCCFGQFFEDYSEEELYDTTQSSDIRYFQSEDFDEYYEPDFGMDNNGQPGDPNVPIHQPLKFLVISGIMIGIVFLLKIKS